MQYIVCNGLEIHDGLDESKKAIIQVSEVPPDGVLLVDLQALIDNLTASNYSPLGRLFMHMGA